MKTESRGSFSVEEYRTIYTALRSFHKQTNNLKAAETRATLRNYVLFLANTGIRHGTEALGLRWRNIEWYERDGERYLAINVDGKTNKRTAIARDRVVEFLWLQAQHNAKIHAADFYATQDLERGVSTHALSLQLGNSTEMIDRHYSKYSPLLNAEVHSGRKR